MDKKRKVSPFLFPYLKRAMDADGIHYRYEDKGGFYEVTASVSNRYYDILRDDAKCLIEQEKSKTPEIPVVSFWRYKHGNFEDGAFLPFSKDLAKFKKDLKGQ